MNYNDISKIIGNVTPNAVRTRCFRLGFKITDFYKNEENNFKCLNCDEEFKDSRDRKFCSNKCSAIYNNKQRNKNKKCLNCDKDIKGVEKNIVQNIVSLNINISEFIKKWKKRELKGRTCTDNVSRHIRKYMFIKNEHKCSKCGQRNEYNFTVKYLWKLII